MKNLRDDYQQDFQNGVKKCTYDGEIGMKIVGILTVAGMVIHLTHCFECPILTCISLIGFVCCYLIAIN